MSGGKGYIPWLGISRFFILAWFKNKEQGITYMIHICLPYKDTTCIPRFHVVLKKNAHVVFEGVVSFIYSVNYLFVTLGLYLFVYVFLFSVLLLSFTVLLSRTENAFKRL